MICNNLVILLINADLLRVIVNKIGHITFSETE